MFILLFIVCFGIIIPRDVFALDVYNNVEVLYSFFVDETEDDLGNFKFKLYDKTHELSFDSNYDEENKVYSFQFFDVNFLYHSGNKFGEMQCGYDSCVRKTTFKSYVPFSDEIIIINDLDAANDFRQRHNLVGSSHEYDFGYYHHQDWNYYTYIPMILEEENSGVKKIIFASLFLRGELHSNSYYAQVLLLNTPPGLVNTEPNAFNDTFLENMDFMRKTILDYSDELWEELNSVSIASSEINTSNKSSSNYEYHNRSLSSGKINVLEETIDDYLDYITVLNFKKVNNSDDKTDNLNIIDKITNPKTWSNGITILFISMLVIGVSSFFIIKRRV